MASFVGAEPEDLIGQLGSRHFYRYKTNGLLKRFREVYLSGQRQQFDFYYKGEKVEVWANLMITRQDDEVMGTFTDLTQIKKLQHQLETMVEELRRSNASLEEFAYAASHDLQEPLRKIHTFSNRLRMDLSAQLSSVQQTMFERIENAAQRMRQLIDDLLAFSQVSTRQNEPEQVELSKVLEAVLQDLETSISETGAVIKADHLPVIKGDERQLRQLFQNLVGNAIKYRKPDLVPEVSITCKAVQGSDAALSAFGVQANRDYYLLQIADNGIGFEQQYAESIFQVFHRLHGRSEYEGTGIGLAIVQKVVQSHGGYISAEGNPGVGAIFRVLLPV
jgi:light-regulated signal transduction histidine kinase (bacteriophytochrome)